MEKASETPLSESAQAPSQPLDARDLQTLTAPRPSAIAELSGALDELTLEERFEALKRLAEAESVFQRMAAYRWLAGMHRLNLRYEMRAKKVLRQGLDREEGLALERVQRLMKLC